MGSKVNENNLTKAWQDRENARSYMAQVGLTNNLPLFVRFFNGDQFPAPTERTKNMPRICENIVRMICRNKKAAILSSPAKIVFKTSGENGEENATEFTNFSDYIQKEMCQTDMDEAAVESGVIKGTYIFHYYWDAEARGKNGSVPGALRVELIDPLNAYFSNPTQPDEQKQKWIMFESREELSAIREKADDDVNKDLIVADEAESNYSEREQEGTEMVTVLTRYFRKNGEVYCEKSTKTVVVNKAYPLTPAVGEALKEIQSSETYADGESKREDPANNALPDTEEKNENKLAPKETRAYLYPVVVGHYERRDKSIYGIGEVEGIIPAQKAINLTLSMIAYNVQMTAWPKYIVLPGALNGQKISNDPGQVITDFTKTGNGIRQMQGMQIPSTAYSIVDMITKLTRTVSGSSEVMTGETTGANMSGAAIAQLQSQALLPVETLKENFWAAKRKQGRVLAQFFKLNYTNEFYTYDEKDELGNIIKTRTGRFDSAAYRDKDIDVVVEATAGSRSSVAADIALLDVMLGRGSLDDEEYTTLYPDSAVSNKTEILRTLQAHKQSKVAMLEQQAMQMQQQMQLQAAQLQEQNKTIEKSQKLIKENQRLQQALMELYVGSTEKLKKAGQALQYMASKNAGVNNDAQALAQNLAKSQGIL